MLLEIHIFRPKWPYIFMVQHTPCFLRNEVATVLNRTTVISSLIVKERSSYLPRIVARLAWNTRADNFCPNCEVSNAAIYSKKLTWHLKITWSYTTEFYPLNEGEFHLRFNNGGEYRRWVIQCFVLQISYCEVSNNKNNM